MRKAARAAAVALLFTLCALAGGSLLPGPVPVAVSGGVFPPVPAD